MWTLLSVAAGGALGAMLRYGVVLASGRIFGTGFPWGTLCVNVLGSFVMGLAAITLAARFGPFAMVGLLGSFTTFSAFSLDVVRLYEGGRTTSALLYVSGSVTLSIAALAAGLLIARGGTA
jgi:CrcB protein